MTKPCFFRVNQVKDLKNIINNIPEDVFLSRYNEDTSVNATTRFIYDDELNVVLFGFEDYKINEVYVVLTTTGTCFNNVIGTFVNYYDAQNFVKGLGKKYVDNYIIYDMSDEEYYYEIDNYVKNNFKIVSSKLYREEIKKGDEINE